MIYDLVILGGGIAGVTAARKAVRRGLRTALIHDAPLGGVCLHTGCIPSKICLQMPFPDEKSRAQTRERITQTLEEGLTARLAGAELIAERGRLCGKTDVFCVQCGERQLSARNVLLATGSIPRHGMRASDVFSSGTLPTCATILGAGAVGLECASFLRRNGAQVTLLEQNDRLLPDDEPEISASLLRAMRRQGIRVRLGERVQADETMLRADGCAPSVRDLGLESVGLSDAATDEQMRTPVPGLYAAGDVTGRHCTAHAAIREAECVVRRICGEPDAVDYRLIPHVLFTDPAVGRVGETQRQALARGVRVRAAAVSLKTVGGYLAAGGDGSGVCKLVADEAGTILGVHLCGPGAAELIAAGVVLVHRRVRAADLREMTFPHPTVSEALREAADILLNEKG